MRAQKGAEALDGGLRVGEHTFEINGAGVVGVDFVDHVMELDL